MSTALAPYDPVDVEPAPAPPPARPHVLLVGSLLAAAAGAVFLGSVLADYLSARDAAHALDHAWPAEDAALPNAALLVIYTGLLLSSAFAQWTHAALQMGDRRQAYLATSFTVAMGLLFVNGMTFVWDRLGQEAGASAYANTMYAVTVAHVLLVVAAIALWVVVAFRVFGGQFDARNREPVVAALVVWHAVVVLGVVVWWTLWFIEGGPG